MVFPLFHYLPCAGILLQVIIFDFFYHLGFQSNLLTTFLPYLGNLNFCVFAKPKFDSLTLTDPLQNATTIVVDLIISSCSSFSPDFPDYCKVSPIVHTLSGDSRRSM